MSESNKPPINQAQELASRPQLRTPAEGAATVFPREPKPELQLLTTELKAAGVAPQWVHYATLATVAVHLAGKGLFWLPAHGGIIGCVKAILWGATTP